jgi:hypothetical protein
VPAILPRPTPRERGLYVSDLANIKELKGGSHEVAFLYIEDKSEKKIHDLI